VEQIPAQPVKAKTTERITIATLAIEARTIKATFVLHQNNFFALLISSTDAPQLGQVNAVSLISFPHSTHRISAMLTSV
jgi:hypothetical protein